MTHDDPLSDYSGAELIAFYNACSAMSLDTSSVVTTMTLRETIASIIGQVDGTAVVFGSVGSA